MVKKILSIGVPNGLENSMFQLGKIIVLSLVSTFGTYAIAANAVSNVITLFSILPGQAICLAVTTVIARCVGAGDYEQAKYCILDEHTRIPEVQLVSGYTWNKLTDEDKIIISEGAKESAAYEKNIWKDTEEAAVKTIEDKNITVTEVNENERKQLRDRLQPIYDKYCSEYMDVVEKIKRNQE